MFRHLRAFVPTLSQNSASMSSIPSASYKVVTTKTFEQAAIDLEASVKRNGFGVLYVHDLGETLRAKGVDFAENIKVFEVCNPKEAAKVRGYSSTLRVTVTPVSESIYLLQVLAIDMALNMALPCRISVYTEKGNVEIGFIKPVRYAGC
jgi:uncharacterized protein (DUF302 family)